MLNIFMMLIPHHQRATSKSKIVMHKITRALINGRLPGFATTAVPRQIRICRLINHLICNDFCAMKKHQLFFLTIIER